MEQIDPDNFNYDSDSLYDSSQQVFARGMAIDMVKSYRDVKGFLHKRYPELVKDSKELDAIHRIALIAAQTWLQLYFDRMMIESSMVEEEEEIGQPMSIHVSKSDKRGH